jgi:hypothetical protein
MVMRKSDEHWAEWMAADAAGDDERAEAALGTAMKGVLRHVPSAALSSRLLEAAAIDHQAGRVRSERLIAAGLVGLAFVMTVLPVGVVIVWLASDAGRVVTTTARACVWLTEWLNAGASIWRLLATTGNGLGHVASSPSGSAVLTVALLMASTAVLALNRYLPGERS